MVFRFLIALLGVGSLLALAACGGGEETLTVYSSRSKSLVQPLLERFAREADVDVAVRYASTASLVGTIQEEGANSPADVVYIAEPGGLGALAQGGVLSPLPSRLLEGVDPRLRSPEGLWVGTSGRSKVLVYNTSAVGPQEVPGSLQELAGPGWRGRVGWAPRHGEFQVLVTAMRKLWGKERTVSWLEGMKRNGAVAYPNLISTVQGVAEGEVDVGIANHYYVLRFIDEVGEGFPARNSFLPGTGPGSLITVAGAGILETAEDRQMAERFLEFLLSEESQRYFAEKTKEYPLAAGVEPVGQLPPLQELSPPDMDLASLADIRGTLELLREAGVLD